MRWWWWCVCVDGGGDTPEVPSIACCKIYAFSRSPQPVVSAKHFVALVTHCRSTHPAKGRLTGGSLGALFGPGPAWLTHHWCDRDCRHTGSCHRQRRGQALQTCRQSQPCLSTADSAPVGWTSQACASMRLGCKSLHAQVKASVSEKQVWWCQSGGSVLLP